MTAREKFLGFLFGLCGLLAPGLVFLLRWFYVGPRIYFDPVLHAAVEAFSTILALVAGGVLYLLRRQFGWSQKILWAACSLMSMGTVTGIESIMARSGNSIATSEALANLLGSLFAVLAVTSRGRGERLSPRWTVVGTVCGSALLTVLAIRFTDRLPPMVQGIAFTQFGSFVGYFATAGFVAAALRFYRDFRTSNRAKDLYLGGFFLLSGGSSFFPQSYLLWGTVWWSWHVIELFGYLSVLVLVAFLGVRLEQELADAEQALKKNKEELERSNHDLERFATIASHDMQEPVRMIVSFLELLERRNRDKLDASSRDYLAFASQGARRLRSLIVELLNFARVETEAMTYTDTDCREVYETVITNLQNLIAETNAKISCGALPVLRTNPIFLTGVLQNLVTNSIKYRREIPPEIHIEAVREKERWVFSVCDNGVGIAPEFQTAIFELFRRLHGRDIEGAGIGLAASKKILDRLGGEIWVSSVPGEGSTFYFGLPLGEAISQRPNSRAV